MMLRPTGPMRAAALFALRAAAPFAMLAAAAAIALPLAGCASMSGATSSSAADEAAIAAFNAKYLGAINDGDIATLSSLTTEGHIMIPPGRPPTVGKKPTTRRTGAPSRCSTSMKPGRPLKR